MTLPIIESMIRGDLRRQILSSLKNDRELSLLWRELHKTTVSSDINLRSIEDSLVKVLEGNKLVYLSSVYRNDRELRRGAEQNQEARFWTNESGFTHSDEDLSLEGVFPSPIESTPTDKFLHLLVKMECTRTKECLKMNMQSMQDDAVIRSDIRKLFAKIVIYCKEANEQFIKESLTQLYFEIYHSYQTLLEKGACQYYETDFENFIYDWKGEFPEHEVIDSYNKKAMEFTEVVEARLKREKELLLNQAESILSKDKVERFLEAANEYGFSNMPIIQELGSNDKIKQLVECMLETKESDHDTFGHSAAMLEYLRFYEWIKEYKKSYYSHNFYDKWCSKTVMNKADGSAFKHYRLSVKLTSEQSDNDSYRFLGWKYKEVVIQEYKQILEG